MELSNQNPQSVRPENWVNFVNPIEAGDGDGEGVVRERRGDILLVDTGLEVIEVPVKLIFDGTIPPLPPKEVSVSRGPAWNASKVAVVVGGVLGIVAAFLVGPPLAQALLSQKINPSSDLPDLLHLVVQVSRGLTGMLGMIGVAKLFMDIQTGKPISDSAGFTYLGSAIFIMLMSTLIKLIFT